MAKPLSMQTRIFNNSLNYKPKIDKSKYGLNPLAKKIIAERKLINPLILLAMKL